MQEGYDGLLRDKTRPSRIAPLGSQIAARVVALTRTDPPAEITYWTAALMAKAVGIGASSVQRIWRAHGLQPHRVQRFKLSNNQSSSTSCVASPLMRLFSRSMRNRQSRRLTAPSPRLPMKKGRAGTMTHDFKRHGTTTLFAAFDVPEGKVIGRCMQRHRHQEFIPFLDTIEARVPGGKIVHVILDNYAAHKQSEGAAMARPPPALHLPLHANLVLVAQCRRGLFCQTR
jgi:transposase